ncbi:MAG: hypothetical protein ACI3Y6_01875 [Candidatus Cryptobacteroides sp.]
MKKNIILLIFVLALIQSCSTMYYVQKNHSQTASQVRHLYKKNGNAFYLSSTYATFSTVWTYNEDKIVIYRIINGKITEKQVFNRSEIMSFSKLDNKEIENAIYTNCASELDGDDFGYIIRCGDEIYQKSYGVCICCLKQRHEYPAVLESVIDDIRNYKMWDITYPEGYCF